MSVSLNKAFVLGRLTRDPEIRTTPNGQKVTTIGIATNRYYKDKEGNRQEQTEFHDTVLWGRLAEIAGQYLVKGQEVLIEGRIQTRSWEGQDGNKRYKTEIIGESLQLGSKPGGGGFSQTPQASKPAEEKVVQLDEEAKGDKKGKKAKGKTNEDVEEIKIEDIPF